MLHTTLIFLLDGKNRILLSMKKRGFWAGKFNGYGWKLEENESIVTWAIRELREESGLQIDENLLEAMGILHFRFPHKGEWNQDCSVFRVSNYEWIDPVETEEMRPEWFPISSIPYASMWSDDVYWLPDLIRSKRFEWTFVFNEANALAESVNHHTI